MAKKVTLKEGLKKSVNIAQVREIMKHFLVELSKKKDAEILKLLKRYKSIKK